MYQGYNSSTDDIFLNPKFGTVGASATTVCIDSYVYFDQVIVIENGFASLCNFKHSYNKFILTEEC